MATEHFDVVVVGTGFASSFFLQRFLPRQRSMRVLVLERGELNTHASRMDGGHQRFMQQAQTTFINRTPRKPWVFSLGFGGSSNCWVGNTPRMLPEDFELRSRYGIGEDWPVRYDDLEPYYCDAEDIMAVAGPSEDSPTPRSRPYPQTEHRFSDVDKLFKGSFPGQFFHAPAARPTRATGRRPVCCANGVCTLCPIDSKFTILNELSALYEDSRVTLRLGATVQQVEIAGGSTATAVHYLKDDVLHRASADLVVLGANALFNPHILQRSGLSHAELGTGLVEQVSRMANVDLGGVDNFQGSSLVTGHGYMLYGGNHRRQRAAALIEMSNRPQLRNERGKWRQTVRMRIVYEDLRRHDNVVRSNPGDPGRPEVIFSGYSPYAMRGVNSMESDLERVLAPLPVERIELRPRPNPSESHILGTTPMGNDPGRSIVDRHLIHHQVRNLVVLGGSTFPTAAPANPTLTLSALALWAADHITGKGQQS
ncbi:GMC family oxidoreductase [soil metagenome]